MGKVRTETIKKTAKEILEKYPKKFNADFSSNKNQLTDVLDVKAKKLRNRIAGYITRLKRIEKRNAKAMEVSEGKESQTESSTK